ncbi:DNA topoisomerase IV subunit A [Clostridium sp. YIM B02515]|uniref:DNA topoisomerase (ATP-hydrolyzing) n=1 Tax=Clostridium rhizosphaerae TaxID=2803861 RepID=A0ABS1TF84_9CLOT|nr:DNA topoisomerase IV subunit A [Clostridium rhizosphaerae]MBL4938039.1 DNA topoisomerase IV subunit A [Clostridium rhizosphaerae]
MAKKIDIPMDNNIIKVPIEEAMPDNYLPYAVEVAKDRALPDVRDGLKPVHRRILYGAYTLRAFPDKPYFKSARIVGDILGKYHPHGDSSVYEAMVILAQDFSTRKPLIDGHGNWGSQDGDSAAAMRYTEARLTPLAMEMIKDIDKDIVEMVENYSNTELEPKVLPGRFPNLLVNGAFGIAVGLATNIPPHNLNEVIDGTLAYIDNNDITTSELINYIKGPDLPTGGILIGKNSLLAAYETGEGRVTLRAKANVEKLESGRFGIVITEFPYKKSKARLLQTISEMTDDKKHSKALEAITDIRDESDRNGIRSVIELKKSIDFEGAEKLLKYLYKKTDLQSNISFNMVALANGKPETMGLKTIIKHYVNHQKDVVRRRTEKELQAAEKRFHIVEGFIKAIDIMDEIIALIRASKSKKDSENNLMNTFGFSEIQAQAIVELMLYKLTGLEIKTFEKEYKELEKEIRKLRKILENEKELLKVIKIELDEIKEKYGDERRTEIIENDEEAKINLEELIVVEDTVITLSNEGFIKRTPLKSVNRINSSVEDIDYREGDFNKFLIESNTRHTVILLTDKGNMYQIKGTAVPEYKWKDKGERLDEIIKGLDFSNEKIAAVFSVESLSDSKEFIFITSKCNMKKTSLNKFITNYSKLQALKLKEDEVLVSVSLVDQNRESEFVKISTECGLNFTVEEPNLEASDRNIASTALAALPPKDKLISAQFVKEFEYREFYLAVSEDGYIRALNTKRSITKKDKYIFTFSKEKVLIFLNDGNVLSLQTNLFSGLLDKEIRLQDLFDTDKAGDIKVLNILKTNNYEEPLSVYFFTKNGMIKRTSLEDFKGDYLSALAYKFKSEKDKLIAVEYCSDEDNKDIFVATKRALGIRFKGADVPLMGKAAAGVIAISLKEDDEAVFGILINSAKKQGNAISDEIALGEYINREIQLVTNKKNKKNISIENIKQQNRAGRGLSLMLIVFDEVIKEVKII